jgi:hypothetical protein
MLVLYMKATSKELNSTECKHYDSARGLLENSSRSGTYWRIYIYIFFFHYTVTKPPDDKQLHTVYN